MKILSITAQKVDSTGSGVFLTELTKGFRKLGCAQAVVCGTTEEDTICLSEDIALFPVVYKTPALPFPICGMSDEMPYESTRYCDLNEEMTEQLLSAFRAKVTEAVESFQPDVILCHHLYFLAALVRELYPSIPVYGQCHGSDLRQLRKNPWMRDWIAENIRKLDGIFALHGQQKETILESFGVGGLPAAGGFYDCIREWMEKGKIIVLTTQVANEGSDLGVYHVGYHLKSDLRVLEAYDMGTEAVVAKLMWILGQTKDRGEVERLFYTPVAKDILWSAV